MDVGANCHFRS